MHGQDFVNGEERERKKQARNRVRSFNVGHTRPAMAAPVSNFLAPLWQGQHAHAANFG